MARDVKVNILGDSRDFKRAVNEAEREASRLDSALSRTRRSAVDAGGRIGNFARTAALGLTVVGAAGAAMAVSFLRAAEESQQVTRQTEAVLQSMGATAWTTADAIAGLSTQLSNQTGIDDELIQSGQNVLLTFGEIQNRVGEGNDIFDRATRAALDMSVALGTDMNSAAIQVGKALNDPVRGLTALRRSGIQFTEQQEDQIRAMVEAGDVAGAQRVMLAELERQFGGSAEAQATASQRLSTIWGNLQEQLGEYLIPIAERFASWMAEELPDAIERAKDFVSDLVDKGRDMIDWMEENETIVRTVAAAIGGVLVTAFGAWAVSAGAAAVATIAATWPIIAIGAAVAALAAGFTYLYQENETFRNVIDRVASFLTNTAWPAVQRGVEVVGTHLKNAVQAAIDIWGVIGPVVENVAGRMVGYIQNIITAVSGVVNFVQTAIDKFRELAGLQGNMSKQTGSSYSQGGGSASSVLPKAFHSGGVIPGPVGMERLALVQAGETVLPIGASANAGQPLHIDVGGERLATVLLRIERTTGLISVSPA